MKGFRIIAIKTGDKPTSKSSSSLVKDNDFLKVLSENTFYPFYSHYQFLDNNIIKYNPESDIDIYKLKGKSDISISINAIVGSNGSGKSTLIELIYWANYNIGCYLKLIKGKGNKSLVPFGFLDLELVYTVDNNSFFKLIFLNSVVYINTTKMSEYNEVIFNPDNNRILTTDDLPEFFYSIVVNYSHYALNSIEIGEWINSLFHKNDGYQTPIVLNPKRNNGIIDINEEKGLLNRRLIANILEPVEKGTEENSLRNIVNGKIAKEIELTYIGESLNLHQQIIPSAKRDELINSITKYFDFEIPEEKLNSDLYTIVSINYIFNKLIKIAYTYKSYSSFLEIVEISSDKIEYSIKDTEIRTFIRKISTSNSHISFKILGVIFYLKYNKKIFGEKFKGLTKKSVLINIENLSSSILEIADLERENYKHFVNTFIMSPPSFFESKIVFDDNSMSLETMSSGEKQRIHSVSSIIYHLVNLNSVESEILKKKYINIHYDYINIILDEIELYYHPDWQRKYIDDILNYIGKINPRNLERIKGINITFLTHSPYILSDIPSTYILYLDIYGKPIIDSSHMKTFGANIHDLLKHSFFLQGGAIGEFAKNKINETINFLNYRKLKFEFDILLTNQNELSKLKEVELEELKKLITDFDSRKHLEIIELIDEPILKTKLVEMYYEFASEDEKLKIVQQKIRNLQAIELLLKS